MKYRVGDIIIGSFPYTDKEESKKRAFLVIADAKPFIWCLMMTKVDSLQYNDGYAYQISQNEINFALRETTCIRMNVIQTIDPKVCKVKLGAINDDCLERIMDTLKKILSP